MERPSVGLGIFIVKEGKILLGKRKNAHGAGAWGLAGGHLEFGETWDECAEREVMEETGLTIKNIRFFSATNDIFVKENKHYVTIFLVAEYESGTLVIKEPDKVDRWEWFSVDALPSPLFIPIKNLLKEKSLQF